MEKTNIDRAKRFFLKGCYFFDNGDFEKAIRYLTIAIKLKNSFFEAYCMRGMVWAKIDKHNNAINDFSWAIRINPEYATAYYCRA